MLVVCTEYCLFYAALIQKRPIILRSLLCNSQISTNGTPSRTHTFSLAITLALSLPHALSLSLTHIYTEYTCVKLPARRGGLG